MIERIRARLGSWRRTRYDMRAAVDLSRLALPFTPWPESALAPSALLTILNDIVINGRHAVVELGAGISTVYLGKVLSQRGGRLISIESDASWIVVVRKMLDEAGVADSVELQHAPLERHPLCMDDGDWYSSQRVQAAVGDGRIDALIVDGPPAYRAGTQLARYPALPVLQGRLADRCAVFLDDIARPGERRVAKAWSRLLGLDFVNDYARSGLSVARRGPSFHVSL
jgi:hypothetical protein